MIAILGGTFDPVHFGHLRPALDLLQDLGLDEVRFVPSRIPPHRSPPIATPEQRLMLLQAALAGEPGLKIDERELEREGPSYMVDTLRSLRGELGESPLCLILGMDAFAGLASWHRWWEILTLCHLIVMQRPGSGPPASGEVARLVQERRVEDVAELRKHPAGRIIFRPVTQLDISASRIRAMIAAGRSVKYLLPEAVIELMVQHRIYQKISG